MNKDLNLTVNVMLYLRRENTNEWIRRKKHPKGKKLICFDNACQNNDIKERLNSEFHGALPN